MLAAAANAARGDQTIYLDATASCSAVRLAALCQLLEGQEPVRHSSPAGAAAREMQEIACIPALVCHASDLGGPCRQIVACKFASAGAQGQSSVAHTIKVKA